MKKRIITTIVFCLSMALLLSGIPVSAAFNHYPYWAMQAAYNNAMASGDKDALLKACEDIVALYATLPDLDASLRVEGPALQAAKVYEERGLYQDALRMYKAYKECLAVRPGMTDTDDVTERLLFADAFIDAYSFTEPTVYVHSSKPADVPFHGEENEPFAGTYVGMTRTDGDRYNEAINSGYLLYATFEEETIRGFDWMLPNTDSYYLLEVAWNIPDGYTEGGAIEYLDMIAGGSFDSKIIPDLEYLNTLENCGVLLRFAAEVNVWGVNTQYKHSGRLEEFKASYIAAFRRIHDLAEVHAPGVAMVYSPNDISNMYVTHEDFYPGDHYVDWVGFSTYNDLYIDANGQFASMEDAYYKRGVYANPMVKIMDIVKTYGDRKPILGSECGFLYGSSDSYQTTEHEKNTLELFYAYINMLYPQVKAVYYFNTNYGGNNYCLFGFGEMEDNPTLAAAYTQAILNNRVIADTLAGKQSGYTRLETLNEVRPDLTLSLYAAYPGNPTLQVEYSFDGKTVAVENTLPYTCTIPSELLTRGTHNLQVTTKAKESVYVQSYTIYVEENGNIRGEKFTHSGGYATCTSPARCDICGEFYGEVNPDNHNVSTAWTTENGQHYHICLNGCGAKFDIAPCSGGTPSCVERAVCTTCWQYYGNLAEHIPQTALSSENGQHFYKCATPGCSQTFERSNCTDTDKNHQCDACGAAAGVHKEADGSHSCAYCGQAVSQCGDTDKDHKCDICGIETGVHEAAEGSHNCSYCSMAVTACDDTDKDHECDICGIEIGVHEAAEGSHDCAYCGQSASECDDTDKDHECDICGIAIETTVTETVPVETEEVPAETDAALAETEEAPTETDAAPGETEEIPAETDAAPAETEEVPAETDAAPAETEEVPAETDAAPAETEEVPAETDAAPGETDIALVETDKAPHEINQNSDDFSDLVPDSSSESMTAEWFLMGGAISAVALGGAGIIALIAKKKH